ncbi:MAG TPA: hypothetical protein DIU39_04675 [Flavobacteriales bacterium]|nr:hypothetical protein [Flavobacteriales bacterium]|tara:strand:- start:87485 stop:87715 length:231 start_codon:yes stop_codon:yes gene_type:complete
MKIKIALLFSLLLSIQHAFSQCAMCKAVVESNLQTGETIAQNINNGILYLMAVPYLAMGVIGYLVYKHYKKTHSAE